MDPTPQTLKVGKTVTHDYLTLRVTEPGTGNRLNLTASRYKDRASGKGIDVAMLKQACASLARLRNATGRPPGSSSTIGAMIDALEIKAKSCATLAEFVAAM